jgi:hypothetical protein
MYALHRSHCVSLLLLGVFALLLAGCGDGDGKGGGENREKPLKVATNWGKVKTGLSSKEVEDLLGPPTSSGGADTNDLMKDLSDFTAGLKDLGGDLGKGLGDLTGRMPRLQLDVRIWEEGDKQYTVIFRNDRVMQFGDEKKQADQDAGALTRANFDRIKFDMTRAEVEAILGPGKASAGAAIEGISGDIVVWKSGARVIKIAFRDGKVSGRIAVGL